MSTNRPELAVKREQVFEYKRELATSRSQRLGVLAVIAAISFAFALFLGWFVGAWLILPFAGIEVGCVTAAFLWIERRADDCDRIALGDASISVTRVRGKRSETHTFTRAWVQIDVEAAPDGRQCGLRLRQSGHVVRMGEFLRETQIRTAARELKQALAQPVWAQA